MTSTRTATTAHPSSDTSGPRPLRRLYLARAGFAAAWAVAFAATAQPYGSPALVLAVAYPAVDATAAALDLRSSVRAGRLVGRASLYANIAISSLAVIAIASVGTGDVGGLLRVWGAWAVAAGVVQLLVAVHRRRLAGQRPLILSGGLSVLAGASFLGVAGEATSARMIAGYAFLGGVFFLVSALRLRRAR